MTSFSPDAEYAESLDEADALWSFRERFAMPPPVHTDVTTYLVGNSLGLQPLAAAELVDQELRDWAERGVRGHFEGARPWAPFHEFLTEPMARIVGAEPDEVVVMNSLTVNLHLMAVTFYRPSPDRHKILLESHAFPSDHFALESHARLHGFDPDEALITLEPREGEETLRDGDILEAIERHAHELALVLLPGVQYYTGQVLPMEEICATTRALGIPVGLDLAHAVGNIPLALGDWAPDFAIWCTYKYLNAGPGATGGAFVHRRHLDPEPDLVRLNGWWGTDKDHRFEMGTTFDPIPTAEAWQVSNAPVLSMTPLIASLAVFDEAGGMEPLRQKSLALVEYMDQLLDHHLPTTVRSITPREPRARGSQLSLRVTAEGVDGRTVFDRLQRSDVECDWRHPDVIRVAPVPLYNSFTDVHRFVSILAGAVT